MARRQTDVTEAKLQILPDNWKENETGDIAQMLGADEASVNRWAAGLRKSMKKQGTSDERISKWLPAKRRARRNVYDLVVGWFLSAQPARRTRGRRTKGTETQG
ncbi:MAG: hypothetical protein ABSC19_16855 [Syntrophorhabdales bacterium]|jgi:hypothetical protein